jgi:hypothetical protein
MFNLQPEKCDEIREIYEIRFVFSFLDPVTNRFCEPPQVVTVRMMFSLKRLIDVTDGRGRGSLEVAKERGAR